MKERIIKSIKNLIIYTSITVVFVLLLNILSAVILRLIQIQGEEDPPYEFPCYSNQEVAREIFQEQDIQLGRLEYQSFLGWKSKPYAGKHFQIGENGLRQHEHFTWGHQDSVKSIAIFGGSTTWGTGNSHDETIPAYLDAMNQDYRVFNYGLPGFNTRQELALLINAYESGLWFDYVIFYDGVNEVLTCDKNLSENDHAWGYTIKNLFQRYQRPKHLLIAGLKFVFVSNTLKLANSLRAKIFGQEASAIVDLYDCHTDPDKSRAIASHLIENWKMANEIVRSHGGKFIAFLQPQLFIGSPNRTYFGENNYDGYFLKEQYLALYPEILTLLEKEQIPWVHDLTDAFDGDEMIYYDFCHPVSHGNKIIADKLNKVIYQADSILLEPNLEDKR